MYLQNVAVKCKKELHFEMEKSFCLFIEKINQNVKFEMSGYNNTTFKQKDFYISKCNSFLHFTATFCKYEAIAISTCR